MKRTSELPYQHVSKCAIYCRVQAEIPGDSLERKTLAQISLSAALAYAADARILHKLLHTTTTRTAEKSSPLVYPPIKLSRLPSH